VADIKQFKRTRLVVKHAVSSLLQQHKLTSLRLLFLSGLVSVIAVVSILSMSGFMKQTLVTSSSELLAGDRQLVSPREIPDEWLSKARDLGLSQSLALEFRTMLFSDVGSQLVEVKAVDSAYPLKGVLEVQPVDTSVGIGKALLQNRLFSLLGVDINDELYIGEAAFSVAGELVQEPDVGFNIGGLQPRVLMSLEDVPATKVLMPGSRAKWRYYFAGEDASLAEFDQWIEGRVNSSQRYQGVQGGRPAIASAIERAEAYLVLASSLAVLLGSLAIALSARQYARQQVMDVAILKTLGFTARDVLLVFTSKLLILSVFVILLGVAFSNLIAAYMLEILRPLFEGVDLSAEFELQAGSVLVASAMTAISVIGFSLPQILSLRAVSPQAVLRPESGVLAGGSKSAYLFVLALLTTVLVTYTENVRLVLLFYVSGIALVAVVSAVVYVLLRSISIESLRKQGAALALAFSHLKAQTSKTVFQASVYAFALCLLAFIFIVRDSLLAQWQAQLPEDAPNHFLINIRDHQIAGLNDLLASEGVSASRLYPMVRGRLSHINDVDVKVAVTKDVGALNRELNLSWSDHLPGDNEILQGQWFQSDGDGLVEVSIESELAENIGVSLGDRLSFTIGPTRIETRVSSIRSVQWDSMQPNFYVFFEPGGLDDFERTFITSFHLSKGDKTLLNKIGREFPTISILEVDVLIEKIRGIVSQVSLMLEVVLSLILAASLLVVAAITAAKLQERELEAGIMRTLGVTSTVLRKSYFLEFSVLGVIGALAGLLCAELGLNLVTGLFLNSGFVLHLNLWIGFPVVSALVLGTLGYVLLRKSLNAPPMNALR
jgi:putative ABC transport system permease protein